MKKAPVKKRTLPTRLTLQSVKKRASLVSTKVVHFVDRRPLMSFFTVLAILVGLIVLSNFLSRPAPVATEAAKQVKSVSVYRIGSAPKITVQAQTKKSGVIEITALSGGVIDKLTIQEGMTVESGTTLLSMSSNYKGENTATVQRQLDATKYQGALATYPQQKEVLKRKKEQAEKTEENSEEMRKIIEQSLSETRTLLSANEEGLRILEDQIKDAESLPSTPANIDAVRKLKQQRGQFIGAVNTVRDQLRSDEYDADDDNPKAENEELTKEIAKRDLDVQLKQLEINLAIAGMQAKLSQIAESLMYPSAPFAGTIQRVFVKEKQSVSPGDPLFVISQTAQDKPIVAVAYVSADVAKKVSRTEPSVLHIGEKVTYTSIPTFVSTEAVQGTLYAVYYPIPQEHSSAVTSEGYISVEIPIGYADTTMTATYIPLDAVYQTRDSSYVFVTKENVALTKEVQLGHVYGRFVEVTSGLKNGDTIILNRNIIKGDVVKTQ